MEERNPEDRVPSYLTRIFPTVNSDDVVDVSMRTSCIPNLDIFCIVCSILMHIVDMLFDYNVAIQYLLDVKITYFAWTICLIIIPSLINVIISKRMHSQEKEIYPNMDNLKNNKMSRRMVRSKLFFVIAVILQLAPILHYYDTLKYALKTRKCEKSGDRVGARRNREKMAREDQDVALLRVFECFLEAAPQQILQLTIILKHHNEINLQFVHQVASIVSSLASMGWAMASYHRSIRLAQQDKSNISYVGTVFQFLWHFFITVARILSISVIASIWPISTIICCIIHWISMIIWIVIESHGISEFCRDYSRPPHIKPKLKEHIYSTLFAIVIGLVHIFIYLNTIDSNTLWKHVFFYMLCFLENVTCNVVWWYISLPEVRNSWYFNACLISCALSFFLGISAMIIYYTMFHPSKKQYASKVSPQIT